MPIPVAGRFCPMTIQQHFNQAKADNPGKQVRGLLTLTARPNDKTLKFSAVVTLMADADELAEYHVASDTSGAVSRFTDVDDAIRLMAKTLPSPTGGYAVQIEVGQILDKLPPADLVEAAKKDKASLTAKKTAINTKITAIDAQLALMAGWEAGNSMQVARKTETQAQKQALVDLVASIDAEVARLTALGA